MSYPANSENPFLDHLLWVMGANVSPVEIESSQTFAVIGRKQALISPFLKGEFELPGNPKNDLYIVPVSGGADSSALAITMSVLYPHIPFRFVFTDTLAETRDLYENMVAIEKFLGIEITRLIPENGGLYGLIESYGGFLPSMRARWCTRDLKLKPYEAYIEQIREEGRVVHSFVGIRADEPKREGLVSKYPFIKTYFPFQTLGIDRRAVFGILQQTVGVPRLYNHRTRSGCSVCPFQRRSELLGLLRWNPDEFDRGLEYEKLSNRDLLRFDHAAIPLWKDTGISANHQTLPFPSRVDVRSAETSPPTKWSRTAKIPEPNLFGDESMVDLWAGAEFFVHPGVGGHGVYWQELVTFSTTRGGLTRQMNAHYAHRLGTPEVKMLTRDEMEQDLKLAVYQLRIPARLLDLAPPDKDSYTWQQGMALSQLKQIAAQAQRTLHAEGMRQTLQEYQGYPEGTFEHEYAEGLRIGLSKIAGATGNVVAMDLFEPKVLPSCTDKADQQKEEFRELARVEELSDKPCFENSWDFDGPRM